MNSSWALVARGQVIYSIDLKIPGLICFLQLDYLPRNTYNDLPSVCLLQQLPQELTEIDFAELVNWQIYTFLQKT